MDSADSSSEAPGCLKNCVVHQTVRDVGVLACRLSLLLLLSACSFAAASLNVWLNGQMLESMMMLLSAKKPLRPRCKREGGAEQLLHRLTADRFPIVADGHLLSGIYFNSLSRSASFWLTASTALLCTAATASRDGLPPTRVQYKFMDCNRTINQVLLHPRLTVPSTGFVPAAESSKSSIVTICLSSTAFSSTCSAPRGQRGAEFEIHAVFQFSDRPEKRSLTMQHRFRKACLGPAEAAAEVLLPARKCKQQIKKKRRRRKPPPKSRQRAANSSPSRRRSDRRQQRRRRGDRRRGARRAETPGRGASDVGRGGGGCRRRKEECQKECRRGCRAQPSDCQQRRLTDRLVPADWLSGFALTRAVANQRRALAFFTTNFPTFKLQIMESSSARREQNKDFGVVGCQNRSPPVRHQQH
uniref:ZP domain-containing protein n=1 Tax=Macrostomum lignano TaxID=282301 RepID=A0A1I8JQS8_9PLAT